MYWSDDMLQRIVSGAVLLAIMIPLFIIGGTPYNIGILVLSVLGLKEFLAIKQTKKELPTFITYISYVFYFHNYSLNSNLLDYFVINY